MKKTFFFAVIILFSMTLSLSAQGTLSGTLSGSYGPGAYHIIGTVNVPLGNTVTLAPGTDFEFDAGFALTIHGTFNAIGTESDSIKFVRHASATGGWEGIKFYADATDGNTVSYALVDGVDTQSAGGGIYTITSDVNIYHSTITNNRAFQGAGIYCAYNIINVSDCYIADNVGTLTNSLGGGLFNFEALSTITNCVITRNHSEYRGGGIHSRNDGILIVDHCLLTENSCVDRGGGIRLFNRSQMTISNSTIADNYCAQTDIYASVSVSSTGSTFDALNCIVWGNDTGTGFNTTWNADAGGIINWFYSCVETDTDERLTENGSFTDDPLFLGVSDYRVMPGSRTIDAGDPLSPYGNEPEPNGGRRDIGYYGNTSSAAVNYFNISVPWDIYIMTGIPVTVADGDAITLFADDVNNSPIGWPYWRVSRWNIENGTYVRYGENDWPVNINQDPPDFEPGLGFWYVQDIGEFQSIDIDNGQITGAADQAFYHGMPLDPPAGGNHGMNMMANPYPYDYNWTRTMVTDGSDTVSIAAAADSGWISAYAYLWDYENYQYQVVDYQPFGGGPAGYTVPEENAIPVWSAFLSEQLTADKALELLFEPRWMNYGAFPDNATDDETWELQIATQTSDGVYHDEYTRIGIGSEFSDGYDRRDAIAYVPYSDNFVLTYFSHPEWDMTVENFAYDFRDDDLEIAKVWEFTVWTFNLPNQDIVLSWGDIVNIDPDFNFRLENLTGGDIIEDMRDLTEYIFNSGSSTSGAVNFRLTVTSSATAVEHKSMDVPGNFGLVSAYPNPFNNEMSIVFNLQESSDISLKVFDVTGRETLNLAQGNWHAGIHQVSLNGTELASGIYFLRLESEGRISSQKIVLLK